MVCFSALCDLAQQRENFLGCDGGKISILAEVITEFGERNAVELNRIFSPNSSSGTLDRPELPVRVSWLTSCLGCGHIPNRWGIHNQCKISISSVQQFESNLAFKDLASDLDRKETAFS